MTRTTPTCVLLLLAVAAASSAEILDRIAVTVGKQVISESAILLDLRVSAFLDSKPVDLSPAAKRRAAGRLVDQILILQEAADSHVTLQVDQDVEKMLGQVKTQYGGDYQAALARYGVTEKDVTAQLAMGLRTLEFTDLRFRPEVQISEQDLRTYYDKFAANLREKKADVPPFESSRDQIQELLTDQRLTEALDRWLAMTRNQTDIVYRPQVVP